MKSTNGTLATLAPVYDVSIWTTPGQVFPRVELSVHRVTLLYWVRLSRSVPGMSVTYTRRWLYREYPVTLCAACLARPSLWDIDCDGAYDTVSCGVCNWLDAFEQRHPLAYA
jgi:hypothetical protein